MSLGTCNNERAGQETGDELARATHSLSDGLGLRAMAPRPDFEGVAALSSLRARLLERTPGLMLGRYRVKERLGVGGMGAVYRGYDPKLCRDVAIKVVSSPRPEYTARLVQEARALATLSHPNVVQVFDVGLWEGPQGTMVYLVMELVEGQTVAQWLAAKSRSPAEIVEVYHLAGRGLGAAHAHGLIHRDFKPQNVMIAHRGSETAWVKVLDFGLARPSEAQAAAITDQSIAVRGSLELSSHTRTGTVLGTPAYMAPEQREGGALDHRSDQYSFCVALREALVSREGTRLRDSAPTRVARTIERGLRRDPGRRFESMHALLSDLEPPRWRRWVGLAGLGVLSCVFMLLLGWTNASLAEGQAPTPSRSAQTSSRPHLAALHAHLQQLVDRGETREAERQVDSWLDDHPEQTADPARDALLLWWKGHLRIIHNDILSAIDVLADAAYAAEAVQPIDGEGLEWVAMNAIVELIPTLANVGRFAEAHEWVRFGESLTRRWQPEPMIRAQFHGQVGALYRLEGDLPAAGRHFHQAVGELDLDDEEGSEGVAAILTEYGTWLSLTGEPAQAKEAHCRASRIMAGLHGEGARWAALHINCAISRYESGELSAASREYERLAAVMQAEGIRDASWGVLLLNWAVLFLEQRQPEEAVLRSEQALRTFEETVGADHPYIVYSKVNLAISLIEVGRSTDARPHLEAAESLGTRLLGEDAPISVIALAYLALVDRDQGAVAAARDRAERAYSIARRTDNEDAFAVASYALARIIAPQDPARARQLAVRALRRCPAAPAPSMRVELERVLADLDESDPKRPT